MAKGMTNVGSTIPVVRRVYVPNMTAHVDKSSSSTNNFFLDDAYQNVIEEYVQRAINGVVIEGYISLYASSTTDLDYKTIAAYKIVHNLAYDQKSINYLYASGSYPTSTGLRKSSWSTTKDKWYFDNTYNSSKPYFFGCINYFYLDYGGGATN